MRSDEELRHLLEFGTWPEEREVPDIRSPKTRLVAQQARKDWRSERNSNSLSSFWSSVRARTDGSLHPILQQQHTVGGWDEG